MEWISQNIQTVGTAFTWAGISLSPLLLLPFLTLLKINPFVGAAQFVSKLIDRISGGALAAAITAAIIMVVAQLAVVIARYIFGVAFTWLSELVVYAFAAMFLLGAAAALREDEHVRVDVLRPRFGEKGRAAIELIGIYIFIIPLCLLILGSGAAWIALSWRELEGSSESDGLPIRYLFKSMIPLFAVLLMAQSLSEAIKSAMILAGLMPGPSEAEVA